MAALNGRPSRQQAVQGGSQGINVRTGVDTVRLAGRLFGRHVTGRAHHLSGMRQVTGAVEVLGQAEVGHVRLVPGVEQDVARLEIAVDHSLGMSIGDRNRDLLEQQGRPARFQRPTSQVIFQALAGNQGHGK